MSDIDITLRLPEDLVEKARAKGILSNERIARFLQAEVERIEAWQALNQSMEPVRQAFRADHPDMTEDDVTEMIHDLLHTTVET